MRSLLVFVGCIAMFACKSDDASQVKSEENEDEARGRSWFYAKYRFVKDGRQDIMVALRVEVSNNLPQRMEVKDLTAGRESRAVEQVELNKNNYLSDQDIIAFSGETVSSDENNNDDEQNDDEHNQGGSYTGTLTLNDNGMVAMDGCCGEMTFVPAVDGSLTFIGKKQVPGEGEKFNAAWWNKITGQGASTEDDADTTEGNEDTTDSAHTNAGYMQYFYGNYKFAHRGPNGSKKVYTAALKVEINADNEATQLWVKRQGEDIVEVALSEKSDSKITVVLESLPPQYKTTTTYTGTGVDGNYEIAVTVISDDGDAVEGATAGTVKAIAGSYTDTQVTPNVRYSLTKIDRNPLDEDSWNALIAASQCVSYQIEFSQQPPPLVQREERFTLEVSLKGCDGNIVSTGDVASTLVELKWRHDGVKYWIDSVHSRQKLVEGVGRYESIYFPLGENTQLANVRYRAIIRIDGRKYTATSNFFALSSRPADNPHEEE